MVKIMTQLQIANRALNRLGARPITEVLASSSDKNSRIMEELYDQSLKTVLSECLWTFATKRILLTNKFPDTLPDDWRGETSYGGVVKVTYDPVTPDDWNVSTTYGKGDQVLYSGEKFISSDDSNTGNIPADDSFWSSYIDPKAKAIYSSLQNGNVANVPGFADTYWEGIAAYPAWTIYNLEFVYEYPSDLVRMFGWNVPSATVRQEVDIFGEKIIISDSVDLGLLYTFIDSDADAFSATFTHSFTEAFVDKLAYDASFMILNSATKTESLLKRYESLSLQKASAENAQDQTPQTPNSSGWVNAKFQGDLLIRNREIRYR